MCTYGRTYSYISDIRVCVVCVCVCVCVCACARARANTYVCMHVCMPCSFVPQQVDIGMRLNGEVLESVKEVAKVG